MTPTDDALLRFSCPQCLTKLKAPNALAGKRTRCPYCQMSIDVPRRSRSGPRDEGYALQQQTDEPPADPSAYLVVACPVCHTRLRPTEDEVGQTLICPDCGTPTVVERPAGSPVKKRPGPAADVGEYALVTEIDRSDGAPPAAEQNYVALLCPTCHTRLHATEDQVGEKLICPDCGSPAVVPPMPPPRKKIDAMEGFDGGYAVVLHEAPPPPAPPPAPPPRLDRPEEPGPDDAGDDAEERPRPRRWCPPLPARPFLDGTFSFPLAPGMRFCTFGLMGLAGAFLFMVWRSTQVSAAPDLESWYSSAACTAVAAILGVFWITVASACSLAVARDTANGCDKIVNWPGSIFLDWLLDPFYLFCGIGAGMLPGAAAAGLLAGCGVRAEWLVLVTPFFVFPVAMLSMLESNSPLGVISVPVLQTLRMARGRWLAFYGATGAMSAVFGAIMAVAFFFGHVVAMIAATVLWPIVWLAYFRLLGRLAWCCSDATIREEWESQEDGSDEEDDDAL